MHVMIGSSSKSEFPEHFVPGMDKLGMDQHQPVGVECAKGHVRPDVGRHQACHDHQRHQNHTNGVHQATIEGIKEAGVGEAMVRLVRILVDPGRNLVLSQMHEALNHVLQQQLCGNVLPIDAAREGIVRGGHPTQHPATNEVATQKNEAFRIRQMRLQSLGEEIVANLRLDALHIPQHDAASQVVVPDHKELTNHHSQQPQDQAQRLHRSGISHPVTAALRGDGNLIVPGLREDGSVGRFAPREAQRQGANERPQQPCHKGHRPSG
mmetsp:Transcript_79385/g.125239  ORF Transcript_79385/g.125239 Transcript_79385/m.125239 type:complete len:266 (-) Transcript_79385:47-844(-)